MKFPQNPWVGLSLTAMLGTVAGCDGASNHDGSTGEDKNDQTISDTKVDASDSSSTTDIETEVDCAHSTELTYLSFGAPFFRDWCTGCHSQELPQSRRQGAPMGVDFDSLDAIRSWSGRIHQRTVVEQTMPVSSGPSPEERQLLATWLACGAAGDPLDGEGEGEVADDHPTLHDGCGFVPQPLPRSLLPRCSAETAACMAKCEGTDVGQCQQDCLMADTTKADDRFGFPIDCAGCYNWQLLACAGEKGCAVEVDQVSCCDQTCSSGTDCDAVCMTTGTSLIQCITMSALACISPTQALLAGCFPEL